MTGLYFPYANRCFNMTWHDLLLQVASVQDALLWRKRVGVLLILCLEGRKKICIIPLNRHSCRWGGAVRCVGLSPVFHLLQRPMHTPWMLSLKEAADTPGGPRFPPLCVSAGRCGSWIRQSWSCSGTCCSRVPEKLFLYHQCFQPFSIVDGYI